MGNANKKAAQMWVAWCLYSMYILVVVCGFVPPGRYGILWGTAIAEVRSMTSP